MTDTGEMKPRTFVTAVIVTAGLVGGALDILAAFTAAAVQRGVSPMRVPQTIASAVQGQAAYQGGTGSAVIGLALHFAISIVAAGVYVLASRRFPIPIRRPLIGGAVFGVGMYAFMKYVVLAIRFGPRPVPEAQALIQGLLIHVFLFGIPIALVARAMTRHGVPPRAEAA